MFNRGSDMICLVCLCCFLVKEDPPRHYHIQFEDDDGLGHGDSSRGGRKLDFRHRYLKYLEERVISICW